MHRTNDLALGNGIVFRLLRWLGILALAGLTACDNESTQRVAANPSPDKVVQVDGARVINADSEPGNWLVHGRTYEEQRYSPLVQINRNNVSRLGLAWEAPMDSHRGLEATPIVVDGVIYTTSTWSRVRALDARSGELLWEHDPGVDRAWGKKLCCDVVNRGVAVWQGKVFVGTLDGYLVSLNAANGEQLWRVDTLVDRDKFYSITGAPRIVKNRVIIGNGGAEFEVRGYISAYDADTGKLDWRFFTVPGSATGPFENPELELAAATWSPDSNWQGGGGTAWDSMAYDPELDLLYVGTGNGGPWSHYTRSPGGGDNLYLASILALRPDSGHLVWHYQTTPGDSWDYTATQHMILADLMIDGRQRQVLMQAPKNGFFYVLDRSNGELISAEKYVYVNWASHVDPESGRPVLTGLADYSEQARYVFPSAAGGHNWQPMSYSPDTGLVYIPARDAGWVHNQAGDKWFELGVDNLGELAEGQDIPPSRGYLKAWDPVTQELAWQKETANIWNGGALATAGGVVFHGTATGHFYALNDQSGEVLLELPIGTGMIAPPISYAVDGRQYIAVMAGWGGPAFNTLGGDEALLAFENAGRLLVFALDGAAVPLPPPATPRGPVPPQPGLSTDPDTLERGRLLYVYNCGGCHGMYGSTPMLPDLRLMTLEKHAVFQDIVLGGLLENAGMSSFADVLSEDDSEAIQAYIVSMANASRDD
ncbi:PQQ-dependent dehydrogenase, methanol/ethanol family [Haliea sp. E1-2-M8]|uniref:PQQ-dependent dehydrogenase, methanol/ethanol family n=1 Tax=Haliea sp. E1-2-M8 TaxID=3064706 RepID=UPI002715935F|nr:PQQ-dependent dehydrogenase, methanol/ethanol family [Haliea sp. E1-2-M8]MDO8861942.1 PQQ-dependent dehydrogenase, methanol/ethanol family [Haliea sp. E1-2-M8]